MDNDDDNDNKDDKEDKAKSSGINSLTGLVRWRRTAAIGRVVTYIMMYEDTQEPDRLHQPTAKATRLWPATTGNVQMGRDDDSFSGREDQL